MPANVKVEGLLQKKKVSAALGVDAGLLLAGMLVAQRAQNLAPIDTGRLKRSITRGKPYNSRRGRAIDVGTNVEYARIQEFGGTTPPHEITPRVKKALAFPGPSGETFVVKSAQHPGSVIPAQPYLRPAISQSRREVVTLIVRSAVTAMKKS